MRRRPQPSRRRGLLRAGIVVVILTALVLLAIFVVSSLLASPATAPTVPSTPGPTARPTVPPRATVRPPSTVVPPHATPGATHKAHSDIALAGTNDGRVLFERRGLAHSRFEGLSPWVASFRGAGDAYSGRLLVVTNRVTGHSDVVGRADPWVRPVWDPSYHSILYVRVRTARPYPGARWTLLRYDDRTRRSAMLASRVAMGLIPLGWAHGRVLYLVSAGTDTSIFSIERAHSRFVSILIPQPVSSASLSPDGRSIAFAVPSSCGYCALDVFNVDDRALWNGPSGLANEYAMAWSPDGRSLAAHLQDRLELIALGDHRVSTYSLPASLPAAFPPSMRVSLLPGLLLLIDRDTGRRFTARAA